MYIHIYYVSGFSLFQSCMWMNSYSPYLDLISPPKQKRSNNNDNHQKEEKSP